ncbi:hypothetical protein VTO73DRAFT_14343 [Trametes versicolor]
MPASAGCVFKALAACFLPPPSCVPPTLLRAPHPPAMTKKAKSKSGFHKPRIVEASNAVLSADGRRMRTTTDFIKYHDADRMRASMLCGSASGASHAREHAMRLRERRIAIARKRRGSLRGRRASGACGGFAGGFSGYASARKALVCIAWMPLRDKYLDEVLRLEGRGRFGRSLMCGLCGEEAAEYRCCECVGGRLLCKVCTLATHALLPLHRIQKWSHTYFTPTSLYDLGLRLRPSHPLGDNCVTAAAPINVVVLHTNGVHFVAAEFCKCWGLQRRTQLLRLGWWPATPFEPQTCATFAVLRHFHLLNLQGKLPAYDFYRTLELQTDNTGLKSLPDRSELFMLMVREWRHVTMAKRAGRGHDSSGIGETRPGELAVTCRACPRPGVNLPDGWENARPEDAWLYQAMIAQDANFRLKNRLRQSQHKDPWLGPGMAYFVDDKPYHRFIAEFATTQEDARTCSGFAALLNALTRNSKGLRSTGVVAVSCRHELFRPNGLGDLQKGERYRNIDYVVASSIRGWTLQKIKDSFDIACEWSKGFFARIKDLPEDLRPQVPDEEWVFIVPKFHIAAHKESCQANFSSNYTPYVARWDGEHVERLWAWLNAAAPSTKEMRPGARWETIDDFCGFANWRKTTQFGDDLLRLLIEAVPTAIEHREHFAAFDRRLRQERPADVSNWEKMLRNWESDHKKPNPYVFPKTTVTRADVQLRYLTAENQAETNGVAASRDLGPCNFIVLGLDIRQAQASLAILRKGATTTLQQVGLQKRTTPLLHKIRRFLQLQSTYMPGLTPESMADSAAALRADDAEHYAIFLPSDLPAATRTSACVQGLSQIEDDLQYADACEALDDLRHNLRVRSSYNKDKIKNVTGQVPQTRAREKQAAVDDAVDAAKRRYRVARRALEMLRPSGDWESALRPLLDSDVVGLNERALNREELAENARIRELGGVVRDDSVPLSGVVSVGEGRRTLSWIWYTPASGRNASQNNDDDAAMRDSLRVEWAKARARAARWSEQVRLVDEEMRRVISATQHIAKEWNLRRSRRQSQAAGASATDQDLDEGLAAYADEHCAMETLRATALEEKWRAVRSHASALINGGPLSSDPVPLSPREPSAVVELAVEVASFDDEDDVDVDDL